MAGSATPMTGIVEFTGNGGVSYHPLDLNFDGEINLADYGVFLAGYATPLAGKTAAQQYNLGDLDRDGKHTIRDYAQFRQQFNLARGPGAFEAALAQGFAVPEPTTLLMLIMAALLPATRRRRTLPAAVPLMIAGLAAVPSADGAPLNETFEGVQLVASIEETPTPGVWSDIGPRGWRIDRTGVPGFSQQPTNNGVREWIGWNFAKKDWWVAAAGDQDRSMFLKGTGTILVADPDEWDDEAHPDDSYYSTYITTPRLDVLSGIAAGQLTLTFDSSWLPEGFDDWALPGQSGPTNNQTATIDVSYNGGPYQNVLTWDSQTGSPTFKAGALDETVNVNLGYNGAPNTSLQIRFGLLNAANDWWWALDNIRVNNVDVVVPVSPTLRINTTTGTAQIVGGGSTIPEAVNGYDISSANGNLAPQGNVGLSFTKPDSIDGPDPDTTVGSNIGESWQLASSTANLFSEFFLDGSSPYLASRTDSLGRIFNPSTPEANRDVLFTYTTIDGEILSGGVEYVSTPANADFDSDGDVDGADFLRWQRNKGTGTTLAQGNADGDGDVDADDLAIWKLKFGLPPATPTTAAVPEPHGVALASLALGVLAGLRRRLAGARRAVLAQGAVAAAAAAVAAGVAQAQSVPAPFVDRNYRMGDVEPGAADGADVNVTWDSAGQPNMNQLIDLTAFTKAGAKPKYIAITGRPDGGTGRGINLNPLATDRQFLRTAADEALNVPEKSPSSMDGILPGGTLDYGYIIDRGFQLWTRPSAVGTLGHIVMDTNNHGVMLRADGKFAMRYNNADYVGTTTATANTWYHLMVVRPFGPGNGSILYVNGVAEAAAVGNYQGEDVPNDEVAPGNQDNSPLVIGANTAESAFQLASTAFYRGIVDDLEMFVMGLNPTSDRGEFKFDRDNKYAAHFKPTNIADLTGDNAITMADVTVFANNWLKEKVLTWTQAGLPRALAVGDLQSRAMGDFNYDGRVNLADWGILNTANPAMGAAALALIGSVPEPSTLVLAAACGGLLVSAARRIRRGAL
ncbi:MAG: hypothetical protein DCC67_15890 [Planctomycetota bacterium]|nr:MAG: hypothetical protein DCC67_15890 [Planctomycetota bacterium]